VGWTITKEEQLTKINLGTKENVQQMKVNFALEPIVIEQLIELLKEFKDVFVWTTKIKKVFHQRLFNIGFNWIPQYHLLIKQATS
jgi:hypothetical protein